MKCFQYTPLIYAAHILLTPLPLPVMLHPLLTPPRDSIRHRTIDRFFVEKAQCDHVHLLM